MEEIKVSEIDQAKQVLQRQSERLTVKTMADYVLEHIVLCCENDAVFAEKINKPEKSFMDCIKYIKDKALEWLKEQQKMELNEYVKGVGGDVPNEICYQWAVDYYNSVPEPKPVVPESKGKNTKPAKTAAIKLDRQSTEKADRQSMEMEDKITGGADMGASKEPAEQISLMEM